MVYGGPLMLNEIVSGAGLMLATIMASRRLQWAVVHTLLFTSSVVSTTKRSVSVQM